MSRKIYSTDYLNNITETRFFYADRDVSDTMTLPYNFHDIKIKPNDLVVAHTINGSFSKLYDNLLHIISQSRLAQSLIPSKPGYSQFLATTNNTTSGAALISSYNSSQLPTISGDTVTTILTGVKSGVFLTHPLTSNINNGIVVADKAGVDEMVMIQDNSQSVNVSSFTTNVDNFTTRQLVSADKIVADQDVLYVLNTKNTVIYKYDMIGLTRSDTSYFAPNTDVDGKLLLGIIGASGRTQDGVRFDNPRVISTDINRNLYVVDTHTTSTSVSAVVKKFDKNSNFLGLHDVTDSLAGQVPADMVFANSRFFLLTNTSIHEYSTGFVHLKEWELSAKLEAEEVYKQLVFSKENNNIVYVVTNKNIYKKFLSKLDKGIGKFAYADRGMNIGPNNSISFVSAVSSTDGETLYVGDNTYGVIYKFNEFTNYQECIPSTFESSFIPLHNINIQSDEFVNNIVYNKSLLKLYYNHALLGNSITTRIVGSHNTTDGFEFKSLRYLLPNEINSRTSRNVPNLDNYIGINEMLLSTVVNRTLKKLYDWQVLLLRDLEVEGYNRKDPVSVSTATTPVTSKQVTWVGDRWEILPNVVSDPTLSEYDPRTVVTSTPPVWDNYPTPVATYNIGDTVSYTWEALPAAGIGGDVTYSTSSAQLTAQPLTGAGLTLNPINGNISGVLSSAELTESVSHYYTLRATDVSGNYTDADFRLDIVKPPQPEPEWIFNGSYTFTWDSPTTQMLTSIPDLTGSGDIAGTYTNATSSLSADGPLHNNAPVFVNTGTPGTATLYFNGGTWCIDLVDDAQERSVVFLRLSGSTTGYLSPSGNYYANDITLDRIGYIS